MSVEISWYDPDKESVIMIRVFGEVTADDLRFASVNAIAMASQSKSNIIHNIVDTSDIEKFPLSLRQLRESIAPEIKSPKLQWVILVIPKSTISRLVMFAVTALSQFFDFRYRAFGTIDEGKKFLKDLGFLEDDL